MRIGVRGAGVVVGLREGETVDENKKKIEFNRYRAQEEKDKISTKDSHKL